MALQTSSVYKCLEKKTLIFGFEVMDLFLLSVVMCALNFLFANSHLKLFFTFGPVVTLALFLRAMKVGKAENYLIHWLKFQFTPGVYEAWPSASDDNSFFQMKRKGLFKYAKFRSR